MHTMANIFNDKRIYDNQDTKNSERKIERAKREKEGRREGEKGIDNLCTI